jgi:hypothetical protein
MTDDSIPLTPEDKAINGLSVVDDLDAAYSEIVREPYHFKWQGRDWSLPHMGELDFRLQSEIESMEEFTLDAIDKLFKRIFGPEQAADWAQTTVTGPFLAMLFERWLAHSGVKSGESEASNESSESTGEKSRPTSEPTTTVSASPKPSTAKRAPRKAVSRRGKSST